MQIQPPFMVSYSITTKCNLKCKHCYSSSLEQAAPDELSTEEAFHLVDDLSRWGIGLLIIDGGEPLCRGDLLDIVRYASSRGIRTTVGSNGTRAAPAPVSWARREGRADRVLDAPPGANRTNAARDAAEGPGGKVT